MALPGKISIWKSNAINCIEGEQRCLSQFNLNIVLLLIDDKDVILKC